MADPPPHTYPSARPQTDPLGRLPPPPFPDRAPSSAHVASHHTPLTSPYRPPSALPPLPGTTAIAPPGEPSPITRSFPLPLEPDSGSHNHNPRYTALSPAPRLQPLTAVSASTLPPPSAPPPPRLSPVLNPGRMAGSRSSPIPAHSHHGDGHTESSLFARSPLVRDSAGTYAVPPETSRSPRLAPAQASKSAVIHSALDGYHERDDARSERWRRDDDANWDSNSRDTRKRDQVVVLRDGVPSAATPTPAGMRNLLN